MHTVGESCSTLSGGRMEWKGKEREEPWCTAACLPVCCRHDYVSCLANPFSTSHGTGAHGAVAARSVSASGVRSRVARRRSSTAPKDKPVEEVGEG